MPSLELRHVGSRRSARPGALVTPRAPFMLHAVRLAADSESSDAVDAAARDLLATISAYDLGRSITAFDTGRSASWSPTLAEPDAERVRPIEHRKDPDGLFLHPRTLAE